MLQEGIPQFRPLKVRGLPIPLRKQDKKPKGVQGGEVMEKNKIYKIFRLIFIFDVVLFLIVLLIIGLVTWDESINIINSQR